MGFYHVWFSTKYRRWLLQGEVAEKAKEMMELVASERGIALLECETMVDHAHLLIEAQSGVQLSWFMKLIKGRSAYEVFRAFPELKLDAHVNSFWQDSFNARLVSEEQIPIVRCYIRTQEERPEKYAR